MILLNFITLKLNLERLKLRDKFLQIELRMAYISAKIQLFFQNSHLQGPPYILARKERLFFTNVLLV